jgi:hypothetical protein
VGACMARRAGQVRGQALEDRPLAGLLAVDRAVELRPRASQEEAGSRPRATSIGAENTAEGRRTARSSHSRSLGSGAPPPSCSCSQRRKMVGS